MELSDYLDRNEVDGVDEEDDEEQQELDDDQDTHGGSGAAAVEHNDDGADESSPPLIRRGGLEEVGGTQPRDHSSDDDEVDAVDDDKDAAPEATVPAIVPSLSLGQQDNTGNSRASSATVVDHGGVNHGDPAQAHPSLAGQDLEHVDKT